jgi:formylglycine-generating enzyme required for sulfatase activity
LLARRLPLSILNATPRRSEEFDVLSNSIFISYRREDAAGHVGRLYDNLSTHFSPQQIFMDVDHIAPGDDFVKAIEDAVGSCDVLIAVIGKGWLNSMKGDSRRLDSPTDFVRLEISAALKRNIRVIPVLVNGAVMPSPQELPASMAELTRRQAQELGDGYRWKSDIERLVAILTKLFADRQRNALQELVGRINRRVLAAAIALALLLTIAVAYAVFKSRVGDSANSNLPNKNPAASPNSEQRPRAAGQISIPPGMVYVPGGNFIMGRDDGDGYERPAHRVTVAPFAMDVYEVTRSDYQRFVQATNHNPPPGWQIQQYPAGTGNEPVTGVSWDDAKSYSEWAGKRLPTEAEWEFAARGTDGRRYPWGNSWQEGQANANGASGVVAAIGTFKGASPFGAFDMVGNVWEWTASDLTAYPGGRLPLQPASGSKVVRGGNFKSNKDHGATTTYRLGLLPVGDASHYSSTGFRCVKDLSSLPAGANKS